MDLQTARSELQNIIAADLTDAEANRLLNDGHKELCVRAEWTRATFDIGPTVAGQRDYAIPPAITAGQDDGSAEEGGAEGEETVERGAVYRPLRVWVAGALYTPTSDEEIDGILGDRLRLKASGLWWLSEDEDGVEEFSLYPTPSQSGLSVVARCIVFPLNLREDTDVFQPPEDFHQAPIYYAAARSLGGSEDDLEARAYYMDQYDGLVGRLKRLRKSRTGMGPVRMRLEGHTA